MKQIPRSEDRGQRTEVGNIYLFSLLMRGFVASAESIILEYFLLFYSKIIILLEPVAERFLAALVIILLNC